VGFEPIAELPVDPATARVYAEGWQSWSPAGVLPASASSPPAADARSQTMGRRPGKPVAPGCLQGEGLLAVSGPDEDTRAWLSPAAATIRLHAADGTLVVSADGPVEEHRCAGGLAEALAFVGARLSPGRPREPEPAWCSWSCYFSRVTEEDVVENARAAARLGLPIATFQIDDGYAPCVGDWLDPSPAFGSLPRLAARLLDAGFRPGIWTAPFVVGEDSALAAAHPDWLVGDADAGHNWNQRLRVLDVTHADAAAHLERVFRTLREWGFGFHKLDFLYAGALDGRRSRECSGIEAYREGLRLIRRAAGDDALLLGCGAPIFPSIGLVDAMRVGPDVLAEDWAPGDPEPDVDGLVRATDARAWMNRRLWINDPDSLVLRPALRRRDEWAAHVVAYGGLVGLGDRIAELDEHGLRLTRAALRSRAPRPS